MSVVRLSRRARSTSALLTALVVTMLAVLACTTNDTLFIQLTLTPTPTITPTPLPFQTKFVAGDRVVVVSIAAFQDVSLASNAEAYAPGKGVPGATCFPGSSVAVELVSKSTTDPNDPNIYYLVTCPGDKNGWISEHNLTFFSTSSKAVVKTGNGNGATMYKSDDVTGDKLDGVCPEGTAVRIRDVRNSRKTGDLNVYVQIDCDKLRGYVVDTDLALAQ